MKSVIIISMFIITVLFQGCSENEPTNNLDRTPFLEITNPVMNSNVPDSTTIKISTNIDNMLRVELYVDQSIPSQQAVFKNPPYEYLWNTFYFQDGSQHILQAKGYDMDGNLTVSKYVIVNVYRFMPSNLQAFIKSDTLIELSWIDNCKFETGFDIEEAINDSIFSKIGEADSNITNYTIGGQVDINKSYYFRVRAKSKDGFSGYTNIATAIVQLNTPNNLDINFISDTAATLSWNDNNDFETGYVIEKYISNGSIIIIKQVPANTTKTVVLDSFVVGEYPDFYIYAKMGYIHGEPAQFPYKTLQFSAPYNLTLTGINNNSLKLDWEYNHSFESGFIIERSTDGIYYTEIARTNNHSFTDNNLDTSINYSYRVAAFSRYNTSAFTEIKALFSNQLSLLHRYDVHYGITWTNLSYDASLIAFGGYTANNVAIYVYNTFTGQLISTLNSADSTSQIFQEITISPDNRLLAAGGNNGYITIWDINSGNVVKRINNLIPPKVMKFSYTGQDLIVERGGDVLYFNTTTWQSEHKFSNPIPIYYMDVSLDQSIIATSDKQTNIKLWDYNSGNLIKEIPGSANAWPLQFNKSGTKLFAIINSDLFGWDISSANVVRHITNIGRSYYMAINDEYDLAVVSYLEFGIAAWEISSGYHTQQIVEGVNWLFSTPGNYIIGQGFNQYYYIWELVKKWTSPIQ